MLGSCIRTRCCSRIHRHNSSTNILSPFGMERHCIVYIHYFLCKLLPSIRRPGPYRRQSTRTCRPDLALSLPQNTLDIFLCMVRCSKPRQCNWRLYTPRLPYMGSLAEGPDSLLIFGTSMGVRHPIVWVRHRLQRSCRLDPRLSTSTRKMQK